MAALTPSGPLAGVRVLEFSQIVALPFGGVVLADLGAEVIKVEALSGDPHRSRGAVVPHQGKRFQSLNRGKRSIAIDLQQAAGRELIYRLMPEVDVVTNNFRLGVADRLGVGYEALRAHRPDLIYCEITGFGNRGPMAHRAATDVVASAYGGLTFADMKTDGNGLPVQLTAISLADYLAGFSAAVGVCAALRHRERTGEGQRIDTSLLAASLYVQDTPVMREPVHDATLRDPLVARLRAARGAGASYTQLLAVYESGRAAARSAFRCYYRAYQVSDGHVVVGALTKPGRDGIRRVLGITDDPSDEPGFDARDPANVAYGDELTGRLERQFLTRSMDEWTADLAAAGVPVSPIRVPEEMSDDPQVQALGLMAEIEHPLFGRQQVAGPPLAMSATPPRVQGPSPDLGEHTSEVLRRLAGLPDRELAELRAAGVIGGSPD